MHDNAVLSNKRHAEDDASWVQSPAVPLSSHSLSPLSCEQAGTNPWDGKKTKTTHTHVSYKNTLQILFKGKFTPFFMYLNNYMKKLMSMNDIL
jgi:hypothetical protein